MRFKDHAPFAIATFVAVPGIALRILHLWAPDLLHLTPPQAALVSGTAILGASFLLLWACDAAQADISQTLALAIVALIAVLPEYAIDMYFTWQAGKNPASNYAHYAVANMTGANRLLIGVAWGAIALLYWLRFRREVHLERARTTELLFLGLATVYAFVIPLKGSLAWYDGVVFLGLYVWYIALASRRPVCECEAEGPAELLIRMPKIRRRTVTLGIFLYAAGAIVANAKPFCEGLIGTGKQLGISEFVLVQWLAPIASEAPEFTVALVFAWRGQASLGVGSLLSSKLNQWTLLVGMIPGVFALAHGSLAHPMPMEHLQMQEILLTAAQSLLGVVLLSSLRFSLWSAGLLFVLFAGQLILPFVADRHPEWVFGLTAKQVHPLFSALYLVSAIAIFLQHPQIVWRLLGGTRIPETATEPQAAVAATTATPGFPLDEYPAKLKTPRCEHCRWRLEAVEARQHKH